MANSRLESVQTQRLFEVAYLGISLLGSWLVLRWALKNLDPNKQAKKNAKERAKEISKRIGRTVVTDGQYEDVVAQEVINPTRIDVSLTDIGGLGHIIDDLRRNIITPMVHPQHFQSSLLRQKRGVLLYGPPGTGKTMLAKALARECGACFINLKASTILSKWYGDTNKLVAAVWSLAYKIQPVILFIDEVDSLLGARRSMEHEATTAMKTEFMQLWEGFETGRNNIVVLGATNKREDLDDAVLRRFSLQYEVPLPGLAQREAILRLTLQRHVDEDFAVSPALLPEPRRRYSDVVEQGAAVQAERGLHWLAQVTDGYSGSDLNELCSQAALIPIHDSIERGRPQPEALNWHHFERVMEDFTPPSRIAQATQQRLRAAAAGGGTNGGEGNVLLQQVVAALSQALNANVALGGGA